MVHVETMDERMDCREMQELEAAVVVVTVVHTIPVVEKQVVRTLALAVTMVPVYPSTARKRMKCRLMTFHHHVSFYYLSLHQLKCLLPVRGKCMEGEE